jgi:hypothetical protein
MFAGSLVVVALSRTHRATMFLSGLLATLWAPAGIVIEGEYWQPRRIVGSFAGPEDVLFAFSAGVFTWLLATVLLRRRIAIRLAARTAGRWLITGFLLGTSLFTGFRFSGLRLMGAISCAMVALGALLVILRPQLWSMPLLGGFVYPVLHLVFSWWFFRQFPHALVQWNLANLSGVMFLGVPVEELEWAFGFGVMWPLLMAHVLDARLAGAQEAPAIGRYAEADPKRGGFPRGPRA